MKPKTAEKSDSTHPKRQNESTRERVLEAAFTLFCEHGFSDVSMLDPVALGRKNWIHTGCEEAGPRVAAIVSVFETCRRLKVPVREYLSSVLPGLANFPINRIAELTPIA